MTIAGAALTAGGVAANSIGQSQVQSATNRALEADRARQQALRTEAAQIQEHSRQSYDNTGAQQADRSAELGSYLKQQLLPQQAPAGTEPSQTSSNITTQEEAKQRGKASTYAQGQATALGDMRGFGDLFGSLGRAQARDAGQIGQIGNFMAGNSSVLPIQLDAASHAGDTLSSIGGLAGGLGKLGISAGLSGTFGAAAPAAAASGAAPALAGGSAPGSFNLGSVLASMPQAAMRTGTTASPVPSFARSGNLYSVY